MAAVLAACGAADVGASQSGAPSNSAASDSPSELRAELLAALDRAVANDGSDPAADAAARLAVARLFIALRERDAVEPDCQAAGAAVSDGPAIPESARAELVARSEAHALLRCAATLGADEGEVGGLRERLRALPERDRERCAARGQTLRRSALLGTRGSERCEPVTAQDVRGVRAAARDEPLRPETLDLPASALDASRA